MRCTVVDTVACRENEHRCLDAALAKRLQDLQATPSGQHEIEHDEIELLGVRAVEAVLTRRGDDNVVTLGLERRRQYLRQLALVLDD